MEKKTYQLFSHNANEVVATVFTTLRGAMIRASRRDDGLYAILNEKGETVAFQYLTTYCDVRWCTYDRE